MPPKAAAKDKKEKQKKTELSKVGEPAYDVCARFLKSYEKECSVMGCLVSPDARSALKQAIEDEKFLTKMVMEPLPVNSDGDPRVLLEPLLTAMRKERYNYIKALYVWSLPLTNKEVTTLSLLLEKSIYDILKLDLMDNMIEVYGMLRLSKALPNSPSITSLSLDYNEFGDEGCMFLSEGLIGNKTMLSLSLNYCALTAVSAFGLSRIVATTAVRNLYLDGNDLGTVGAEKLITPLVEQAEGEIRQMREQEAQQRAAEEAKRLAEEEAKANWLSSPATYAPPPAPDNQSGSKKKKEKKGKKGKKQPKLPPEPGPWINKLHLADNGIDLMDHSADEILGLQCLRMFRRLIAASSCLEEIDLDDNVIGDLGGCELVEGLTDRKEVNGFNSIKLRTTYQMKSDTLKTLIQLGSGAVKKKERRGREKKK